MGNLIAWSDLHAGFATWVQGVLVLISLAIAIGVPWWQRHSEYKEAAADRKLRANAIAVAIFPELLELRHRIAALDRALRDMSPPGNILFVGASGIFSPMKLPAMPLIDRSLDSLYLLGPEVGGNVLQLISTIGQLNRLLDIADDEKRIDPHLLANGQVSIALKTVEAAMEKIPPYHDYN